MKEYSEFFVCFRVKIEREFWVFRILERKESGGNSTRNYGLPIAALTAAFGLLRWCRVTVKSYPRFVVELPTSSSLIAVRP